MLIFSHRILVLKATRDSEEKKGKDINKSGWGREGHTAKDVLDVFLQGI